MKHIFIAAMAIALLLASKKHGYGQNANTGSYTDANGNPMLLGQHPRLDLEQPPFADWFIKNYLEYTPDTASLQLLKKKLPGKHFEIFMGTWCGDSRREVPRIYKILDLAGASPDSIKLILLDDHDATYKQSPTHEEKGKRIHRVPDLIIYDHNYEINRIVESSIVSLEKDLLNILSVNDYRPQYKAAAWLQQLADKDSLSIVMKNCSKYSSLLKAMVSSPAEINTLGYVWMAARQMDNAAVCFVMNSLIFPSSANVFNSLGEFYLNNNNKQQAIAAFKKVLELEPGNAQAIKVLAQLN